MPDLRPIRVAAALLSLVFALTVGGCKPADEGLDPNPPAVAFEGEPLADLAGKWKTSNSTYTLNADGSYRLQSQVSSPGGNVETDSAGEWRVSRDRLLFRDENGVVSAYAFEREGPVLKLRPTGNPDREIRFIELPDEDQPDAP
ncbi:MAG: hypothetical protein SNJ74_00460 [Fimbriimonadaceae bacterium]